MPLSDPKGKFMRADVLERDPERVLPDDETILQASASGELTAPECLAVLRTFEAAYAAQGMTFPAGLAALLEARTPEEGAP